MAASDKSRDIPVFPAESSGTKRNVVLRYFFAAFSGGGTGFRRSGRPWTSPHMSTPANIKNINITAALTSIESIGITTSVKLEALSPRNDSAR